MNIAPPEAWAQEEFGRSLIPDRRWKRRLVVTAARAARRPAGHITEVFTNAAERQGTYGLLESDKVSYEQIRAGAVQACARRCADEPFVFCPVDGTSLTLTDRAASKDFGPIGTRSQGARGIKVLNAMVVSPSGVPIGIGAQQWWTRPNRRRRKHRDFLVPQDKETRHWIEAVAQTRAAISAHAPRTRCWFQLDREGDAWPLLMECDQGGSWFTIRSGRNRRVLLPDGGYTYLRDVLASQPVQSKYALDVRGGPNRQARTATMVVRACRVTVQFRDKRTGRRFPKELNVVHAVEQGTTPRGDKPIEWTLLTNRPIEKIKDLTDVIRGYSMRWRIEELHRTWKSAACNVEDTQLRSTSAVVKWATILITVAVRIERIKFLSRQEPDRPATDEFTPAEIKAAALLRFGAAGKAKLRSARALTIADVTLWIAHIGGYTGRTSSGGPPGSIVIARGLDRVLATASALEALDSD